MHSIALEWVPLVQHQVHINTSRVYNCTEFGKAAHEGWPRSVH